MEQSIGVFGENALLWTCWLALTPARPQADVLLQQANYLLEELRRSPEAQQLPVISADDGMFAIAALMDEVAMSVAELRPYWSQAPLQATRFNTNNAGVELFERLQRVRQGPQSVVATYVAVLGIGFQGCYGLPGADRYALVRLRRELSIQLGVDPDRDWTGGVLERVNPDAVEALEAFKEPWYRSVWIGRALVAVLAISAMVSLALLIAGRVS